MDKSTDFSAKNRKISCYSDDISILSIKWSLLSILLNSYDLYEVFMILKGCCLKLGLVRLVGALTTFGY